MTSVFTISYALGHFGFMVQRSDGTQVHIDWTPRSRQGAFYAARNWLRRHQNEVFG